MIKSKRSELLELVLFFSLFIQLFCGQMLFVWGINHRMELALRIILTVELPVVLISFFVFAFLRVLVKTETEREREEYETQLQLEKGHQLVESLETWRHDYRNQLQVLHTLAGMGKNEEIRAYIEECGAALDAVTGIYRVGNAVIEALFLSFQSKMNALGIRFELRCPSKIDDLVYSPLKLSRIIANILQNAVESVTPQTVGPIVSVAISLDDRAFYYTFWNNGPPIPSHDLEQVFAAGFSRKIGEHRGYGLLIVKNLVEELGGTITVHSNEADGTEFLVSLPIGPCTPL